MHLVYAWLAGIWFGAFMAVLEAWGVSWPTWAVSLLTFMVIGYALIHAVIR